ncbi:MAG: glycosyltransferase, partial [Candidatus Omnitrophica bacterium]|nr:glycosyltransferase [Candidatus Omnitrophota bacterium]
MRKVLIIFYNWPPRGGVGMFRTMKFAKYLPYFGWEPTILTPAEAPSQVYCDQALGKISGVRILKTGYVDILNSVRRLFRNYHGHVPAAALKATSGTEGLLSAMKNGAREVLSLPDENIGWYAPAMKAGEALLRQEKFDLIYSSSPPETSHLIAGSLKKRVKVPWIADLRDPWSGYHHTVKTFVKKFINNRLDKIVLKHADHIITVSMTWAELFKKNYSTDVSVITNGFDEEDFFNVNYAHPSGGKFLITYCGKLHSQRQSPAEFFSAIRELLDEGRVSPKELSVRFYIYGSNQPDFDRIKHDFALEGILNVYSYIDYKECLKMMRESNLLLLVGWRGSDATSRGVLPAKAFDYLGARRPILLLSSEEDTDLCQIDKDTGCGNVCS